MPEPVGKDVHGNYADPVRQLLTIGEIHDRTTAKWPNYPEKFAIGDRHVDELIRLATDPAFHTGDPDAAEIWAPVHAWRALGQLQAEASIAPLLTLLKTLDMDEAADAELPVVFAMIGPSAIPLLTELLADPASPSFAVNTAISAIKEIAVQHPERRDECVGILVAMLPPSRHTDPSTSGFAVWALIDLTAVETIDVIRDAFQRQAVEPAIAGDLEDVEIALGLRERRATPPPHYLMQAMGWPSPPKEDRVQRVIDVLPKREKVGRNDPCPCGSGKKYKKCCLTAR